MFRIEDCPNGLYQWDLNRKIRVEDKSIKEVHFCNLNSTSAYVVEVIEGFAAIPNILLQESYKLKVYASNGDNVRFDASFDIEPRAKPQSYIYEETQIKSWEQLEEEVKEAVNSTGYYVPKIDDKYNLSWEPSKPGLPEAPTVNIKGETNNSINVYCWGDSLTQGSGGNVNGWHLISYPSVLAERCNAVNLGILSDNVPTIMARMGADAIVLPECVIPASSKSSVVIGNTTNGLTLESGRIGMLLKYGDCGINPCFVNDTPCVLYRDYSGTTVDGLSIRLRRLNDGLPIEVAAGTKLTTFAAKYYKGNGLHIFWMGANGGYGSDAAGTNLNFQDYIEQLQKCVNYVAPADYLIVYARERKGYATNEETEIAEIKATFPEHVIELVPQLNDRGLLYAETSIWDGEKVNGVPKVLDAGDGCHFSFYGYMAIGKIIWEYVAQRINAQNSTPIPPVEEDEDNIGKWVYKLKEAKVLTNGSTPINTHFKPFAEGADQWSVAVKYSADLEAATSDQWGTLVECEVETSKTQLRIATLDANTSYPDCNVMCNAGGFKIDAASMGLTLYEGNYHTLIITKDNDNYTFYLDNNKIYGNYLTYPQAGNGNNDLYIGGWSSGWGMVKGTIMDVRIYNECITDSQVSELNEIFSS